METLQAAASALFKQLMKPDAAQQADEEQVQSLAPAMTHLHQLRNVLEGKSPILYVIRCIVVKAW